MAQEAVRSAASSERAREVVKRRQPRPFGPVLYFRGASDDAWRLAAVVGIGRDEPPTPLAVGAERVEAQRIAARETVAVWRYELSLPRDDVPSRHAYRIGKDEWTVCVPGRSGLRVAFTSCNGTEDWPLDEDWPERNERWRHLLAVHAGNPFHLLIQGGDQYYADLVWKLIPELNRLRGFFGWKQRRATVTAELSEALDDFYDQRYTMLWSQRDLAPILASVPSAMMWDDHDIFDGWGSHPPNRQRSALHQEIFRAARFSFEVFQLAKAVGEGAPGLISDRGDHFSWAHRIGPVAVVAPDLRATRRFERVMSDEQWSDVAATLKSLSGVRILLLLSTVPLVSADVSPIEPIFLRIPGLLKQHNDLRDQWQSYQHRDEWTRMLAMLLEFAEDNDAQVLILSGEIHMGACGVVRRGERTLWQLTSSGVVNAPPSSLLKLGFEGLSRQPVTLDGGIDCRVLRFFDGSRYLRERNWLELEFAADRIERIAWHAEHRADPFLLDRSRAIRLVGR